MSTIRVVNLQHTDATEPNIVLESDGTAVFASGITISGGTNLTVSGIAEFASGTVSAPTITFIDDNNTGIYEPAADTVAITTAATERLRVDSSGNVGIDTTSPAAKLEIGNIVQSGSEEVLTIDRADGTQLYSIGWNSTSNEVSFSGNTKNFVFKNGSSSSETMRIDSSGNLLIGTSTSLSTKYFTAAFAPGFQNAAAAGTGGFYRYSNNGDPAAFIFSKSKATTIGNHTIVAVDETLGYLGFTGSDGAAFQSAAAISCQVDGTPGVGDMPGRLVFYTTPDGSASRGERMRIASSGNVGINETNPQAYLHIDGSAGDHIRVSNGSNSLNILNDSVNSLLRSTGAMFYRAGSLLHIFQNTDGTSEAMRIDSTGRLGIGTTTPSLTLDVTGANDTTFTNFKLNTALTGTNAYNSGNAGSGISFGGLYNSSNNETTLAAISAVKENTTDGNTAGALIFGTRDSSAGVNIERMRILSGGGLTFNGDTATANALDDYEEGSWTPTVIGTTSAGTVAYAARIGDYTKVGNMVTVLLEVGWSSGTGTGFLAITGLPFTTTRNNVGAIGASSSLTFTTGQIPYVFTSTSANLYVGVSTPSSGAAQLAYDTAASIYVTFSYMLV